MRDRIVGREDECERLEDCLNSETAQLIIVYGRRRVGKTFLVNEFFDQRFAFKVTGAHKQPKAVQLRHFMTELNRKSEKTLPEAANWEQAFEYLREYLDQLNKDEKQIVFMDEMPWMDTQKSGFLAAFEWFWNDWGSAQDNLIFIVCGSASAWLDEKFSENKGGLFNRQTCRLYLKPFQLSETEEFLKRKGIMWTRYEIAECYMIMGGIPFYLNQLKNRYSLSQNIDRIFFRKQGELWDEFDHLFRTLFSNNEAYIRIAEALSKKTGGLTREEIGRETGIAVNGTLTKMLNHLISSGFVRVSTYYGKKKKDQQYQLSDPYTAFYFKYVQDHSGKDEHFWSNSTDNPSRRTWAGLAFEQLCKDHIPQIKRRLGISGVLSRDYIWYTRGDVELGIPGAQIDLIIERRDRVINLCEMKFSVDEYLIDKAYDASLRNKMESFRRMANSKASLQITMITTYGLRKNMYSSRIQSQVVLDDLFQKIID